MCVYACEGIEREGRKGDEEERGEAESEKRRKEDKVDCGGVRLGREAQCYAYGSAQCPLKETQRERNPSGKDEIEGGDEKGRKECAGSEAENP